MKKILSIFVILICSVISGFASYKALESRDKSKGTVPVSTGEEEMIKELSEESKTKGLNYLFLGYGGAGHDGGNLSDVIMVIHIDPENKKATLISIPRDMWVEIPIRSDLRQNFKINAAYAIGSDDRKYPLKEPQYKGTTGAGTLTKKVISEVTGLTINNYVSVDFDSFKKIVDLLGGLEVQVPKTFDDNFYPIKGRENETCGFSAAQIAEFHAKYSGFDLEKQFGCRYEHLHFDAGKNKMDGETALKFVRSRHSSQDGGDFARSQRQKELLVAAESKILSKYALTNAKDIYKEFQNLVRTDMGVGDFEALLKVLGAPKGYNFSYIGLTEENVLVATKSLDGQFILIPKQGENVWRGVQKYIYDEVSKL